MQSWFHEMLTCVFCSIHIVRPKKLNGYIYESMLIFWCLKPLQYTTYYTHLPYKNIFNKYHYVFQRKVFSKSVLYHNIRHCLYAWLLSGAKNHSRINIYVLLTLLSSKWFKMPRLQCCGPKSNLVHQFSRYPASTEVLLKLYPVYTE